MQAQRYVDLFHSCYSKMPQCITMFLFWCFKPDNSGHVIDLVNDQLPDVKITEEDKKKNLELLEEAKKVSERFLMRRGRKSRSSLPESPTGRCRFWKRDFTFYFRDLQRQKQASPVIHTLLLRTYTLLMLRSKSLCPSSLFHIKQNWPISIFRCNTGRLCKVFKCPNDTLQTL